MEKIKFEAYICDTCKESFETKEKCLLHENKCPWNEKNKSCMTCNNRIRSALFSNLYHKCSKEIISEQNQDEFYNIINCKHWEREK